MKLHIGCGSVYLDGYINMDITGAPADAFPQEVVERKTTLGAYYRGQAVGAVKTTYIDQKIEPLPAPLPYRNEVEDIVFVQCLEHFGPEVAKDVLRVFLEALAPGGRCVISVPDLLGTLVALSDADMHEDSQSTQFYIRHIYGTQRNEFFVHRWGYTFRTLPKVLKDVGFSRVQITGNLIQHSYPALVVEAFK